MKKLTLFGITLLWLGNSVVFAQTVYVDNSSGDDGNTGSETSPIQTIGKALELVRQADNDIRTIRINPGFMCSIITLQ